MSSKIEQMKNEVDALIKKGTLLYLAMLKEIKELPDDMAKDLKEQKIKLPNFHQEYDTWYSEALVVIKQLLPDRLDDFKRQYKDEKRKGIDFVTYGISDYLLRLKTSKYGEVIADASSAVNKMTLQNSILQAVQKRFESSLFDIKDVLQADIFDSDLKAAEQLAKNGFARGGGAIAGVVLEKHLGRVCESHNFKSRKKNPTISDYYTLLKENEIINTAQWRFIQHLGDLRNLCDHPKDREPTKDDVINLVEGVEKIIKTVF